MSDTVSSNLPNVLRVYRLVKAMSPAQKGEFRKYSKFWGDRSKDTKIAGSKKENTPYYLQLFDLINKFINEVREEEGLQKYLEKNRLGNRAVLSDRAEHLYEYLLESLRNEADKGKMLNQLNHLLQDINTLYHKGLEKDAFPIVAKARKLAQYLDRPTYMLELLWWDGVLRSAETERTKIASAIESRRLEADQTIRHIKQAEELRAIHLILRGEVRSALPYLSQVPDRWLDLFHIPASQAVKTIPGFRSKRFFLLAFKTYWESYIKLHPEESAYCQEKMFEAVQAITDLHNEEFQLYKEEEPVNYRQVLEICVNTCFIVKQFDYAEKLIEEWEKRDKSVTIYVRLNYYLAKYDIKGALMYIESHGILNNFAQKRNQFEISRQITLCYQCGMIYFADGQWSKAQDWFAHVISGHRPDAHNVAVTAIGLLDVLCSYELKSYGGSFNRVLEAFKGRQKRADQWPPILQSVSDFIQAFTQNDVEEVQRSLPLLRTMVLDNRSVLGTYGLVLAWAESKLNRSLFLVELKKYD